MPAAPAAGVWAGGDHEHLLEALGHLQDGLTDPDDICGLEQARRVEPLAVDESPVRRPEIFDREPTVGPAGDAGVTARELRIEPELSRFVRCLATDQQIGGHAQKLAALRTLGHPQLLAGHQLRSVTLPQGHPPGLASPGSTHPGYG